VPSVMKGNKRLRRMFLGEYAVIRPEPFEKKISTSNLDISSFRAQDHDIMTWMAGSLVWLAVLSSPTLF
jgi:hypothetical protein